MKNFLIIVLFICVACGKQEELKTTESQEQIISAARNVSFESVISFDDIKVGDELIFEIDGIELSPTFNDLSIFTYPEDRTDCGCYIFKRVFDGNKETKLSDLELIKFLYFVVDHKPIWLKDHVEIINSDSTSIIFKVLFTKEILGANTFIDLVLDKKDSPIIKKVGFLGWDGGCHWREYIEDKDQGDLYSFNQEFYVERYVDISYQLKRTN